MGKPQDLFSDIAGQYARARFGYPDALFSFIASKCPTTNLAWDCATGSGQAAVGLAKQFVHVVATDISRQQLNHATPHYRIVYQRWPSDQTLFADKSVDVVTVAQAIHWFELLPFWREVDRVLRSGGILAYWGYVWPVGPPAVNRILDEFKTTIAPMWPPQSALLHQEYADIHPPFHPVETPGFSVEQDATLEDFLAHLETWTGTRRYVSQTGDNVVNRFRSRFAEVWDHTRIRIVYPLVLRVYRKQPSTESTAPGGA